MITFHCPNGHKINCREQLAGKSGVCPKCQAPFTVPRAPTVDDLASLDDGPAVVSLVDPFDAVQQELGRQLGAAMQPPKTPPRVRPAGEPLGHAGDELVVFLCPNGHRLNSPARLVGKAGQCPHCHARFLVPSPDEVPADDLGDFSAAAAVVPVVIGEAVKPAAVAPAAGKPADGQAIADITARLTASKGGAFSHLFAALWHYKTHHGAAVELHLREHKVIVPEHFSARYSTKTHGLFTETEANGAHRLTLIAWDAIERVSVRGVTVLPADMFANE